jgi:hypothetical protein
MHSSNKLSASGNSVNSLISNNTTNVNLNINININRAGGGREIHKNRKMKSMIKNKNSSLIDEENSIVSS